MSPRAIIAATRVFATLMSIAMMLGTGPAKRVTVLLAAVAGHLVLHSRLSRSSAFVST